MEFSEKIKLLRKHNHLTQEEFAQRINVSRKTVSGWENKRSVPDTHILNLISENFDISVKNLIDSDVVDIYSVNHVASLRRKKTINYVFILQLLLIVVSYISLFKLVKWPFITIILCLNSYAIRNILLSEGKKFKMQKTHILICGFNLIVGIISTLIYLESSEIVGIYLFYISGVIVGTLIHIIVLSYAVILLSCTLSECI